MKRQTAKLIGGAGTGKTTELLLIMDGVLAKISDPRLIGFVSFTRAARSEAAARASDQFGCKVTELEQAGWFRTLHSVCYRCLGVGKELLAGGKETKEWLQEALQDDVEAVPICEDDSLDIFSGTHTDAERALQLWNTARNRLQPLATVWSESDAVDQNTPSLGYCEDIIERYEQAKRLDGRVDYVDMLARYAGYQLAVEGASQKEPDGDVPELPVWFFDEQQDTSALLHAVCQRLSASSTCKWVYIAGDPFQAIYNWAGADHHYFMDWKVDKQRVMPRSWRCAAPILAMGEDILSKCSDYWDRGIEPAEHDGAVEDDVRPADLTDTVSPAESWLILARSNFEAARLGRLLSSEGVPWVPTKGLGGWNAPVRNEACKALLALEVGAPISGDQWQHALKQLPSTSDGVALLERGTKKRFADLEPPEAQESYPWVMPGDWPQLGITENLSGLIRSRAWRALVKGSHDYADAVARWGQEVIDDPQIRVGTIHSVKGAEADNVWLDTTISRITYDAAQTQEGYDAEQRVWYVGATRARKRLVIARDPKAKWRKRL